ncbi:MAG: type II secretion system minor pseudopilin GspK [Burkholderiaceae bacterium]|nr:type II secretion system minor pseudopilin GspK [Burkholderiaceae bacterium]
MSHPSLRQRGAALLAAMLTVTLVATLAAAALWQQWRSVEVETSERARVQAAWILVGALDWSRLILSEDGRSGGPDHLAEPWAVPLQEARLSTFLAAGDGDGVQDNTTDTRDAFLSGQIVDAQSRLNVMNLVDGDKVSATALVRFGRLFELLGLPRAQASVLANQMLRATSTSADDSAPLMPYRVDDLVWLGLPAPMVAVLAPYITVLPISTPVNLNTASAEVLYASGAADDLAAAQTLVAARQNTHFKNAKDALKLVSDGSDNPNINDFAIASRYFEVRGRLRLEQTIVEERSLVQRDGNTVKTLWRERGAIAGLDEALAPVTR